jgi:hypothetical protein
MQQRGHSRDRFRCSAKVSPQRVLAGPVQNLNRASSYLEALQVLLLMAVERLIMFATTIGIAH